MAWGKQEGQIVDYGSIQNSVGWSGQLYMNQEFGTFYRVVVVPDEVKQPNTKIRITFEQLATMAGEFSMLGMMQPHAIVRVLKQEGFELGKFATWKGYMDIPTEHFIQIYHKHVAYPMSDYGS